MRVAVGALAVAGILVYLHDDLSVPVKIKVEIIILSHGCEGVFKGAYGIFRERCFTDIGNLKIRSRMPQTQRISRQIAGNSGQDYATYHIPLIIMPPVFPFFQPAQMPVLF